jgi:TadE-like protein
MMMEGIVEAAMNNQKPGRPARPNFTPRLCARSCRPAHRCLSRGQSAVELALLAPVLILLLLAAADFSRVYYASIEATNAARADVQYGAQSITTASDTAGMQQAALNDASNLSGLTATASNFCECPPGTSHVICSSATCSGMERCTCSWIPRSIFKRCSMIQVSLRQSRSMKAH